MCNALYKWCEVNVKPYSKLERNVNKAFRRMLQLQTKQSMVRHFQALQRLEQIK